MLFQHPVGPNRSAALAVRGLAEAARWAAEMAEGAGPLAEEAVPLATGFDCPPELHAKVPRSIAESCMSLLAQRSALARVDLR